MAERNFVSRRKDQKGLKFPKKMKKKIYHKYFWFLEEENVRDFLENFHPENKKIEKTQLRRENSLIFVK